MSSTTSDDAMKMVAKYKDYIAVGGIVSLSSLVFLFFTKPLLLANQETRDNTSYSFSFVRLGLTVVGITLAALALTWGILYFDKKKEE